MVCVVHNGLLSLLDKIVVDTHIPSVRHVHDVREEIRTMYHQDLNKEDTRPESGDSGGEGEGVVVPNTLSIVLRSHLHQPSKHMLILYICGYGRTIYINICMNAL